MSHYATAATRYTDGSSTEANGSTAEHHLGRGNLSMKRRMNWNVVLSNVREASEELSRLVSAIEEVHPCSEGHLSVALAHAYHHLNTACRVRRVSAKQYAKATESKVNTWGRFPSDLWLQGVSGVARKLPRIKAKPKAATTLPGASTGSSPRLRPYRPTGGSNSSARNSSILSARGSRGSKAEIFRGWYVATTCPG